MENRVRILSLKARNIKVLREVEIDSFGEITEIRGDTGQGKTSILESIEAALSGIDASMVRRGTDAAEIVLELDVARVARITAATGKTTLTVTGPDGKPMANAKAFLQALCPDSNAFRPLDFVMLGGGAEKGKTDRLRQQRNMLLDAMPVRLNPEAVRVAIGKLGEDAVSESAGVDLSGIDFEQHALAVCSALELAAYGLRKSMNTEAEKAEFFLNSIQAPKADAPKCPVAEAQASATTAREALITAKARAQAAQATEARRQSLLATVANADAEMIGREIASDNLAEADGKIAETTELIESLRRKIREAEAVLETWRERRATAQQWLAFHERADAARAELQGLGDASGPDAATIAALAESETQARANLEACQAFHKWHAASEVAATARAKANIMGKLVELFRDYLPRSVVSRMKMPVDGLSIVEGIVCLGGIPLHQLGTSEQIRVAVCLAAALNPRTGFILIDRAESLGTNDRLALAQVAHEQGLQLIMSFVDAGATAGPGRVIMENGNRKN